MRNSKCRRSKLLPFLWCEHKYGLDGGEWSVDTVAAGDPRPQPNRLSETAACAKDSYSSGSNQTALYWFGLCFSNDRTRVFNNRDGLVVLDADTRIFMHRNWRLDASQGTRTSRGAKTGLWKRGCSIRPAASIQQPAAQGHR